MHSTTIDLITLFNIFYNYSVAWQAGTKRSAVTAWNCQQILMMKGERHVFRQVEAVTTLRFVHACHVILKTKNNWQHRLKYYSILT
ncbi:MAG: hypothetical protein LBC02_12245 [Planctomycetaceae bacterium]|nr:hypothetical protein [Planctomycetaceae bacterium]